MPADRPRPIPVSVRSGYSASVVGIDSEAFAHFALSLAWRSSITSWEMPGGLRTTTIDLGAHQESRRRYLRGETPFPDDIAVIMTGCTDEETRRKWILPTQSPELGCESVVFPACGFILRVWMGPNLQEAVKRMCVHTSVCKTILVSDWKLQPSARWAIYYPVTCLDPFSQR